MVWIKIHSGPTAFCLSANTTELGHRHRSFEAYSLAQQINELTAQEFSFNYTHTALRKGKSHIPHCSNPFVTWIPSFIFLHPVLKNKNHLVAGSSHTAPRNSKLTVMNLCTGIFSCPSAIV